MPAASARRKEYNRRQSRLDPRGVPTASLQRRAPLNVSPGSKAPRASFTVIAVAAAIALGAAAWWWWPRPHAQAAARDVAPVAAPPSPSDHARRDAAIALAEMPADPWTLAESFAASEPEKPKSHCGADEAPQFAEAVDGDGRAAEPQTRPAGPHFLAAQRQVDATLRTSADPYDRAVADWLNVGDVRTPSDRLDALVQDAATTSDPRVYALAYGSCASRSDPHGSCQLLSARQWAALDAGNAMPWLFVFDQATEAGDVSGQQEALAHMAASTRFDDRSQMPVGEVAAAAPDDDDALAGAQGLVVQAVGLAAANSYPITSLTSACRNRAGGDVNRVQQCQAIGDMMFDHTDSLLLHVVGASLYYQSTGDASRRDIARAERATFGAHWSPATGFSECQEFRNSLKRAVRRARLGELEASREEARKFVTP